MSTSARRDVVTKTTIDRPCADLVAYAGDPTNAPQWYANITSVRWQTEPPVRVGSRMDFVARFLGRTLAYTYEVIELVPGQRLVMRTAQGLHLATADAHEDPDGATQPR